MPKKLSVSDLKSALSGGARDPLFGLSKNFPKLMEIELVKLRPNPDQPRKIINEEGLEDLARSIEEQGLLQPITVKEQGDSTYMVVAGERRWRAHERLGKQTIFAILTDGNPDEIAIIENLQREDLNPIDEAEALGSLMERHDYTQEQLGRVIGKRQSTVSEMLRLATLPEEIKREYRAPDTAVSKTVLIELVRLRDPEVQLATWEAIKSGNLTHRQVRQRKAVTEPPSPTYRLIAAGRTFAKTLARVEADGYTLARDEIEELRALYERIGRAIASTSQL
jgi:ParB family transcriptional regulator, chromosome partitioning protein